MTNTDITFSSEHTERGWVAVITLSGETIRVNHVPFTCPTAAREFGKTYLNSMRAA